MTKRFHDDSALAEPGALGIGAAPACAYGCGGWWFTQDLSGAGWRAGRREAPSAAQPGAGRSRPARVRSDAPFGRG